MNIQQLRYLVSATDAGSLSGAARALGVSQPVVSRSIHDLEREYDVVLFRRNGRSLVPTKAALEMVSAARRALDALDDVDRAARRIALERELVIVSTNTNFSLLSPVVRAFSREHPDTTLCLRRVRGSEIASIVMNGDADLGFRDFPDAAPTPPSSTIVFEPVWETDVVLVSPIGTALPPAVTPEDLKRSRLILAARGRDRSLLEGIAANAGGPGLRPAVETDRDDISVWITAAQSGAGSFLSYKAVVADIGGVELRLLDPPITVATGFVYRSGSVPGVARAFLRLARECAQPSGCRPLQPATSPH
jgi:DNA-binding transcriptional LysR family regulator